jgi:fructuronate reductase
VSDIVAPQVLSRAALGGRTVVPPVRIVHLGLGAFHRAHQAWYTAHASDADQWGIAAYSGRRPGAADALAAQGGVYTLVVRALDGDQMELVDSIVRAVPGDDLDDFVRTLAAPSTAVLTLTVTEAGYGLNPDGHLDLNDAAVGSDLQLLATYLRGDLDAPLPRVATVLGRVTLALAHRRRGDAPPLAVVPCDNLPNNGALVARVFGEFARLASVALADWIVQTVSFVSTSVDRITPRTTEADIEEVERASGWTDAMPVVTEPFSDWVLSGTFPSGSPDWESAGARFVDDIEPWEARKLWLLNGAHTILACRGLSLGYEYVSQAAADPACRSAVELFWDDASANLPDLDIAAYRASLLARFDNARIAHLLAQIADDTETKLRVRVAPVARRERAAGRPAGGCALAIAAWIEAVDRGVVASAIPLMSADISARVARLDPELATDERFCELVEQALLGLGNATPRSSRP